MSLTPAFHESLPCKHTSLCVPLNFPRFRHHFPGIDLSVWKHALTCISLCYPDIDPEPTPDALAAARALVSAEQAASSPPPLPSSGRAPSFTPVLQAELDRLSSPDAAPPQAPLDLSRYEAQEAPPTGSSPDALRAVLQNAYVSDAYLRARAQNLDLLDRWGKNAWLIGNYHLEAELRAVEKDLADVKRDIDIVNVERKRRQEDVKAEMLALDDNWRKGVSRVLETELAVEELKAQIREELRKKAAQDAS
ncbi:Pre-mRNA-splicing factor SPF27 [Paramyrothecium foliicola]|nr:Pre-mRNA-splicing factor SPF27 [Paramyrothecium foliicola]